MARGRTMVPFGTELFESQEKGTLVGLGSFVSFTTNDLEHMIEYAGEKHFSALVLFPHNEKTLRNMGTTLGTPFSKRLDQIGDVIDSVQSPIPIQIEPLEGKRDKYTPIDYALRFLLDKYESPLFLYMDDQYANQFASFPVFEEWIRRIRLVIRRTYQVNPHPKLLSYENRWEYVQ